VTVLENLTVRFRVLSVKPEAPVYWDNADQSFTVAVPWIGAVTLKFGR
tara:strand:+ start:312 stop:455 length:144 start_codon:yes stop_codon:yes gene_type:complete